MLCSGSGCGLDPGRFRRGCGIGLALCFRGSCRFGLASRLGGFSLVGLAPCLGRCGLRGGGGFCLASRFCRLRFGLFPAPRLGDQGGGCGGGRHATRLGRGFGVRLASFLGGFELCERGRFGGAAGGFGFRRGGGFRLELGRLGLGRGCGLGLASCLSGFELGERGRLGLASCLLCLGGRGGLGTESRFLGLQLGEGCGLGLAPDPLRLGFRGGGRLGLALCFRGGGEGCGSHGRRCGLCPAAFLGLRLSSFFGFRCGLGSRRGFGGLGLCPAPFFGFRCRRCGGFGFGSCLGFRFRLRRRLGLGGLPGSRFGLGCRFGLGRGPGLCLGVVQQIGRRPGHRVERRKLVVAVGGRGVPVRAVREHRAAGHREIGEGRLEDLLPEMRRARQAATLGLVPAVAARVLAARHAEVEGLVERVELLRGDLAVRLVAGGGEGFVHRRVVGHDEVLQAAGDGPDALEAGDPGCSRFERVARATPFAE